MGCLNLYGVQILLANLYEDFGPNLYAQTCIFY